MNLELFFPKKWGQAPFSAIMSASRECPLSYKMGPVPIFLSPFFLGQKQRVLEPYSLSLFSMVALSIPGYFFVPTKRKGISLTLKNENRCGERRFTL